jgi:hypothetical protein
MIELMYFEGCPNYESLLASLPRLLESAGADGEIELTRVDSVEAAQRERFLGSPTLRIDGRDVEPEAGDRTDFGLKCRLYRTAEGLSGTPPDEWILTALAGRGSSAPTRETSSG